jgi:polysaccharide export outer membrane protein
VRAGISSRLSLLVLGSSLCLVPLAATQGADTYEIGPGDVLKVVVLGQAEMSGSFTVDGEGMLAYPILGKIKAGDLTTAELERKLTRLLVDGRYLKRPQVSVTVADFGSQKVFVMGEVQRPGQYALKADRSLLTLLGDIGPLGPEAGHEVIVIRAPAPTPPPPPPADASSLGPEFPAEQQGAESGGAAAGESPPATTPDGTPSPTPIPSPTAVPGLPFVLPGSEVFHVRLLELMSGNPEKNLVLRARDTVYFPKASHVYVTGSVARPGAFRFEEGMTVLQVLTMAGGATDRGAGGRTKLIRIVDGKKVERRAKPAEILLPEDTLFVPERFF